MAISSPRFRALRSIAPGSLTASRPRGATLAGRARATGLAAGAAAVRLAAGAAAVLGSPTVRLRQLLPRPDLLDTDALLADLAPPADAPPERPYTLVNFISSLDGRATFHGRSGPLGDAADREMFHALRARADAVLAGTVTVGVERYGRLIRRPEARERRRAAGTSPEPLLC